MKSERWQVKSQILYSEICTVTVVRARQVEAQWGTVTCVYVCMYTVFRKVFLKMIFCAESLKIQREYNDSDMRHPGCYEELVIKYGQSTELKISIIRRYLAYHSQLIVGMFHFTLLLSKRKTFS